MNKKIITGLIVLMGISILGIIGVQLIWINNAIKVKNELFERGVNEALFNTVSKLENIHNFGVINNLVFEDSFHWLHEGDIDVDMDNDMEFHIFPEIEVNSDPGEAKKAPGTVKIIRELVPGNDDALIEIKVESDSAKKTSLNTFRYEVSTSTRRKSAPVIICDSNEANDIVIINSDTLISDADSLYSISTVKIDSILTKLDTIELFQPNISKRARRKAVRLKNIANQAVSEIRMWDVKEIDHELIEDVLKSELENKNIPIDFDFGIKRDSIIELPKPVSDSLKLAGSVFQVDLYPNDIIQKNIKLAVFFPSQDSFIFRSLNWLMIASLIFSVFILGTFTLSVYYILRQKKISEMKSDFINNMTHEFKTPIATISVATDSITNNKVVSDPERIRYFARMIKKENARMNRQVEDILTIARLDRKDFEFSWETVDAHELINDAVQGIKLQVEKQNGKIVTNFDANNSIVTTDRIHCTNVIYNLLDNAIKYSSGTPEITISTRNESKGILISVEDKGIGMSKAVQSKIFEKFYRKTSGNIHNIKGFGLGLSYVKAILDANRGTISVNSEQGKGSKFDVFLPFVRE